MPRVIFCVQCGKQTRISRNNKYLTCSPKCQGKEKAIQISEKTRHNGWVIEFMPKPIPIKAHDYDVSELDGEGFFTTGSISEAKEIIDAGCV